MSKLNQIFLVMAMGVCWVGKSEIGFKKYLHFLFNQCLYWFAACKDTKIRNVFYVGLIIL